MKQGKENRENRRVRKTKIENIHDHNNMLNSYDFPMCENGEVVIRFTEKPISHIE